MNAKTQKLLSVLLIIISMFSMIAAPTAGAIGFSVGIVWFIGIRILADDH